MKTSKSSDNSWHWGHLLGAAPNRAKERYSLYKETKGSESIGHLAMAAFWSMPILGGAVSLIGRVCSWASEEPQDVRKAAYKALSKEEDTASTSGSKEEDTASASGIKEKEAVLTSIYTKKDIEESKENQRNFIRSVPKEKSNYYCSVETIDQADFSRKTSPLCMDVAVAVNSSQTVPIEDVTCDVEVVSKRDPRIKGRLLGIFDRLGGDETAKKSIQQTFGSTLTVEKNIKKALTTNIGSIQYSYSRAGFRNEPLNALMCYIDKTTNTVHVGGVGNNQACIIRQYSSGERKIIPLAIPNEIFINDQNKTLQISYVAFPLKKGDVLILGSSNLFESISEDNRTIIGSKDFSAKQIANSLINKKAIVVNFS